MIITIIIMMMIIIIMIIIIITRCYVKANSFVHNSYCPKFALTYVEVRLNVVSLFLRNKPHCLGFMP